MTTLHTEPCGCKVVRNTAGDKCGVHIEWCALHGAAEDMRDACEAFAPFSIAIDRRRWRDSDTIYAFDGVKITAGMVRAARRFAAKAKEKRCE